MVLRDKLRATMMSISDIMTTYLTEITQIHDELATVGEIVTDQELVSTSLNGFTKPWEVFVSGIVAQKNLPNWK